MLCVHKQTYNAIAAELERDDLGKTLGTYLTRLKIAAFHHYLIYFKFMDPASTPQYLSKVILHQEKELERLAEFRAIQARDPALLCEVVADALGTEPEIVNGWIGPVTASPGGAHVIYCALTMMARNTSPLISVAQTYGEHIFEYMCVFNNIWALRRFENDRGNCEEEKILMELVDLSLGKSPDASIKWTLGMTTLYIRHLFGMPPRPLSDEPRELNMSALFPNFTIN